MILVDETTGLKYKLHPTKEEVEEDIICMTELNMLTCGRMLPLIP